MAIESDNGIEQFEPDRDACAGEKLSVDRKKIDSIIVYDVTEDELDSIITNQCSTVFNLFIASCTSFSSFLIALLTATDYSLHPKIWIFFLLVVICTFISSGVLGGLWWSSKKSFDCTINKIKSRGS